MELNFRGIPKETFKEIVIALFEGIIGGSSGVYTEELLNLKSLDDFFGFIVEGFSAGDPE